MLTVEGAHRGVSKAQERHFLHLFLSKQEISCVTLLLSIFQLHRVTFTVSQLLMSPEVCITTLSDLCKSQRTYPSVSGASFLRVCQQRLIVSTCLSCCQMKGGRFTISYLRMCRVGTHPHTHTRTRISIFVRHNSPSRP